MKRSITNRISLVIIILFSLFSKSYGQINSDAVLYDNGHLNYLKQNWAYASIYLFAYIQRDTKSFESDQAFKREVIKAFDYSMGKLTKQVEDLKSLQVQAQNNNNTEDGSSQDGLTTRPPPLRDISRIPRPR
jgi:hypothetical protein